MSPATCLPPTMSIRAQLLVSCLSQVPSSPATCLLPNCFNPSATACLLPPPGPFEPGYLSPTQPCLFEHNAHLPPPPSPFEPDCLSPASTRPFQARLLVSHPTVSIQAQLLMSHPPPGPFEPNRLSLTQPCPFKCNCLCLLERNHSPVIPWQLACCSTIHNLHTFL